uniref:XPR1 n=1 Tax=Syphacia muris TaxID=451379 RepID=A0A0N5AD23_9BILA
MAVLSSLRIVREKSSSLPGVDASSLKLTSKFGRNFRLGILAVAVIAYPLVSLTLNGPLIKKFPYFQDAELDLSDRLDKIITEEYERYLRNEKKERKNVVARFFRLQNTNVIDSIVKGTIALKTGVAVALPFYVNFNNRTDVVDYCKRKLKTFLFCDDAINVNWDSDIGKNIADTLCLSDNALRFLVLRDLYSNEQYKSFVSREVSWVGYSTVACFLTFIIHSTSRLRHSLNWFFLILLVSLNLAYFGSENWYGVYRHAADLNADTKAGMSTVSHLEGGKEYYWKLLKRNRLLSSISNCAHRKVTTCGDIKSLNTPLLKRYLGLKGVRLEDDEFIESCIDDFDDE